MNPSDNSGSIEPTPDNLRDSQDEEIFSRSRIAKWFPALDRELENLFGSALRDLSFHVISGVSKGFLCYFVPVAIIRRGIRPHLRRALAFGVFVGAVRFLSSILKRIQAIVREPGSALDKLLSLANRYRLAISGGAATLVALTVDGQLHKSSIIVCWAMVRALRSYALPNWPDKRLPRWLDRVVPTVVLMLSSAYKLPTWNLERHLMNSTHIKFLDYHGGKPRRQLEPFVLGIASPCPEIIHPGQGCLEHGYTFWLQSFRRAVGNFVPVYAALLLFSSKRNLWSFVINLVRSSMFLSTYCTSAWLWACLFYRYRGPVTLNNLRLHSSLTGLAALIERPSRAMEMAWYEATYVLDSLYLRALASHRLAWSPLRHAVLLAVSMALLLHHHKHQPAFLMNWLLKLSA